MSGMPQATVEGNASSSAAGGGAHKTGSHGGGTISYFFMYAGPGSTTLPIIVQTLLDISLTGNRFSTGNGYANLLLTGASTGDIANMSIDCNVAADCFSATYNTPVHVDLVSNVEYEIRLSAGWQVEGGNTAHVLADPMMSIDLTQFTGDPSQFTLLQSSGVGNGAAATPEPATFGLMSAAAAGIILLRRRRA